MMKTRLPLPIPGPEGTVQNELELQTMKIFPPSLVRDENVRNENEPLKMEILLLSSPGREENVNVLLVLLEMTMTCRPTHVPEENGPSGLGMMKNFLPVNENLAVETQLPDWQLAVHVATQKTLPSPLRYLTIWRVEKIIVSLSMNSEVAQAQMWRVKEIIVSLSMNSELAGRKRPLSVAQMYRWPQLLHLQVQQQGPIGTKNENHLREVSLAETI
jgi:hypothetical protein